VKIKIAFCISNFSQGGAETQFWNLVRGLDRNRFDVHVIQIENKGRRAVIRRLDNTKLHTICARFQLDPVAVLAIRKYIKRNRIQILQSFLFMDNQFARVVGALCRIPVVTSVRGELRPILGTLKTFIEYRMRFLSDRIVTNSGWLKSELVGGGAEADRVEVIYNGVDVSTLACGIPGVEIRSSLGLEEDARYIGIVARFHPMKDHETFFKAAKNLMESDSAIRCLVLGGGSEEVRIREYISDLGIQDRVLLVGEVRSDIGCWYRAMNVLMLTSRWGESFPNVILEAMSCGVPVVATDVSAVKEIITNGVDGFIVDIGDSEALAMNTNRLLDDPVLLDRVVKNGLKKVQSFNYERMISSFSQLYTSLVDDA